MNYSRKDFREWLTKLPDEPFCQVCKCPVRTYLEAHGAKGIKANAVWTDTTLTRHIDAYCDESDNYWHTLRPRQVIAILDELEAA